MAMQSRIAPLPRVYCPKEHCLDECEWKRRTHGTTERDVAKVRPLHETSGCRISSFVFSVQSIRSLALCNLARRCSRSRSRSRDSSDGRKGVSSARRGRQTRNAPSCCASIAATILTRIALTQSIRAANRSNHSFLWYRSGFGPTSSLSSHASTCGRCVIVIG